MGGTSFSSVLRWLPIVLLVVVLLGIGVLRHRFLDIPLERDEGEFAYGGQLLLAGELPYVSLYAMKLPGIYLAFAVIEATFGQTVRGVHWGLLWTNLASIVLMYLIGRRLFDRWVGLLAAAAFALLTISPVVQGTQAQAEHFALLPALIGAWILIDAVSSPLRCFLAGVGFGAALVTKQHAAAFLLFGVGYLSLQDAGQWKSDLRGRLASLLALLAGSVLPLAATAAYFYWRGAWAPFFFWTFTYPRYYVHDLPLSEGMANLWRQLRFQQIFSWPIWLAAGVGLAVLHIRRAYRCRLPYLGCLAIASALAVMPGLWFRSHYFIFVAPIVALLAALPAQALYRGGDRGLTAMKPAAVVIAALAILWPAWKTASFLWPNSPDQLVRQMYDEFFIELRDIGDYLADAVPPGERIGVLGSEPQVFFYSHRGSVTPHIYMYPLLEDHPFAEKMQKQLIEDFERAKPKYLVVNADPMSWGPRDLDRLEIWDWVRDYVPRHYHRIARFERLEDGRIIGGWGVEATRQESESPYQLFLMRRNAGD